MAGSFNPCEFSARLPIPSKPLPREPVQLGGPAIHPARFTFVRTAAAGEVTPDLVRTSRHVEWFVE